MKYNLYKYKKKKFTWVHLDKYLNVPGYITLQKSCHFTAVVYDKKNNIIICFDPAENKVRINTIFINIFVKIIIFFNIFK